jgi:hypothetical protein
MNVSLRHRVNMPLATTSPEPCSTASPQHLRRNHASSRSPLCSKVHVFVRGQLPTTLLENAEIRRDDMLLLCQPQDQKG